MTYPGFMNCIRCGKRIDHPDNTNADYVIAPDMVSKEPRAVFIALRHNQATRAKFLQIKEQRKEETPDAPDMEDRYIDAQIPDNEFDAVEIPNVEAAKGVGGLVKVVAGVAEKDIQKTGIICPGCYKPTDTVIWGVHKAKNQEVRAIL